MAGTSYVLISFQNRDTFCTLSCLYISAGLSFVLCSFSCLFGFRELINEQKARAFLRRGGNRKLTIFTSNLSSYNHIRIAKYIFLIKDE